jgi:hypothetical protein
MSRLLFKRFVAQIVTSGINPLLRISTIEIIVCAISSEPSLLAVLCARRDFLAICRINAVVTSLGFTKLLEYYIFVIPACQD